MNNVELNKIKAVLGSRTVTNELIEVYYEDMLAVALSYCRMKTSEPYPTVFSQAVRNAVIQLINNQGDEGITTSTGGSQTYNYEDIIDNMKKRLHAGGLVHVR